MIIPLALRGHIWSCKDGSNTILRIFKDIYYYYMVKVKMDTNG